MTREEAASADIDRVYKLRERKALECCQGALNSEALRQGLSAFRSVQEFACPKCQRTWKRKQDDAGGWERAA